MIVKSHKFEVGDLLVNKTAHVLFSCDFDSVYFGILFVEVDKDEVLVVVEIVDYFVTVQTANGQMGWQSAVHFELLQKWNCR